MQARYELGYCLGEVDQGCQICTWDPQSNGGLIL